MVGYTLTNRGRKEFSIFLITKDDLKEYKIDFENQYYPQTVSSFFDEVSEKLVLSGVYTEKTRLKLKVNPKRGLFFSDINLEDFSGSEIKYYPLLEEENDLLKYEHSITEFRKLGNGNYQFLGTCKSCEISSPRNNNTKFVKNNENVKMTDLVDHCNFKSLLLWTMSPSGELVQKDILRRNAVLSNFGKDYTYVLSDDYAFLFYFTKITKAESKKYRVKAPRLNYLTKVITINPQGEIVSDQVIPLSKESKFTLEDLSAIVYGGKIIFGGKVNQKVIKLKREFSFGGIDLEDLK